MEGPQAWKEKRCVTREKLLKMDPGLELVGQLEFAHALNGIEWTEYSQAKWDLRRAICDAARNIPSSCFTFIDLQYTFMLQSFGLIRSNTLKEPVYRRPSFFAMQNVYSYFDDDVHAIGVETRQVNGRRP